MEKYFERIKGTDTTKNTNWPEANQLTTCKYGRGIELATIDNKSILIRRRPTVPQQITPLSPGKSRRGKEILSCLLVKILTPSFLSVHVIVHDWSRKFPRDIPSGGALELSIPTKACAGTVAEINKLEHVVLTISFIHRRRGDVSVLLMSPSGTKNEMLSTRHYDDSKEGLDNWGFMTVHTWGK